ncbi:MAG: hypothetical protein LBV72_00380 [Tannerella sp.]|jgi:hypothetical protein|nr:hypothetical protein [Tannerella sp.]
MDTIQFIEDQKIATPAGIILLKLAEGLKDNKDLIDIAEDIDKHLCAFLECNDLVLTTKCISNIPPDFRLVFSKKH